MDCQRLKVGRRRPNHHRGMVFATGAVITGALIIGVLLLTAPAEAGDASTAEKGEEPWEVLDERAAKGEQCLVCRQPIHEGGIVEVRYKGRTFHVAESMLEEFKADPDLYFQELQARSALFDERAMETPPMRTGWLWLGFYVLAGLIFAAGTSYAALNRGKPSVEWFFAGLFFNVLAFVAVLLSRPEPVGHSSVGLSKIPSTSAPRACPKCGGVHHPSARVCDNCGGELAPAVESEIARA